MFGGGGQKQFENSFGKLERSMLPRNHFIGNIFFCPVLMVTMKFKGTNKISAVNKEMYDLDVSYFHQTKATHI